MYFLLEKNSCSLIEKSSILPYRINNVLCSLMQFCLVFFFSSVKDWLTVFLWVYFWALCSVLLIYLSVLLLVPHCLDYCRLLSGFRRELPSPVSLSRGFETSTDLFQEYACPTLLVPSWVRNGGGGGGGGSGILNIVCLLSISQIQARCCESVVYSFLGFVSSPNPRELVCLSAFAY